MTALPSVLQFGVPGGPELVIVFLLFVLAFPAASLALGVGVGWWLRGRRGESDVGANGAGNAAAEPSDDETVEQTRDGASTPTDDAGAVAHERDST